MRLRFLFWFQGHFFVFIVAGRHYKNVFNVVTFWHSGSGSGREMTLTIFPVAEAETPLKPEDLNRTIITVNQSKLSQATSHKTGNQQKHSCAHHEKHSPQSKLKSQLIVQRITAPVHSHRPNEKQTWHSSVCILWRVRAGTRLLHCSGIVQGLLWITNFKCKWKQNLKQIKTWQPVERKQFYVPGGFENPAPV